MLVLRNLQDSNLKSRLHLVRSNHENKNIFIRKYIMTLPRNGNLCYMDFNTSSMNHMCQNLLAETFKICVQE